MTRKIMTLLRHPALYTAFAQNVIISVKLRFKVLPRFRQKALAFLCLLFAIIGFPGYQVKAQTSGYTSKHALMGGGGFVNLNFSI